MQPSDTDRGIGTWYALLLTACIACAAALAMATNRVLSMDLQETGDTAGDALQALAGMRAGWFPTGHHTDQWVPHPGPFGLLLKAAGEVLHSAAGVGLTPMGAAGLVLAAATAASVIAAAYVAASGLRSAAAGSVFLLVALYCAQQGWAFPGIPPLTFMLNILAGSALLLALAAAFASLAVPRTALPYLAVGSGALMHLHTPSAPLGAAGIALCVALLNRTRSSRDRRWWVSAGLLAAFLLPLAARVVTQWPWPWTIVTAMRQFAEGISTKSQVSYERWDLLTEPVIGLLAAGALTSLAMLCRRGSRRAGIVAAVVCGYAGASWMLASTHTANRSFLTWLPVALLTLLALAAGWAYAKAARSLPWPAARAAFRGLTVAVALLACGLLYSQDRTPGQEAWRQGTGNYSATGAAAILAAAQGRPIALDLSPEGPFSAVPWPALILGLERASASLCLVQPASGDRPGLGTVTGMAGLAGTPTCPASLDGHAVFASRPFGDGSRPFEQVVYEVDIVSSQTSWSGKTDPLGRARIPGYEIGVVKPGSVTAAGGGRTAPGAAAGPQEPGRE